MAAALGCVDGGGLMSVVIDEKVEGIKPRQMLTLK
jgi:hypothetical protein